MSDNENSCSLNKRKQRKRSRRETDDASSSESSYKRKEKKHRHKDRKKKCKKRSKSSSKKTSTKDSDSPIRKDEDVSLPSCSESLVTSQDCTIGHQEQIQQEQLRKQEQARRMAPMSRDEYQEQQSTIREIYDEQTGRYRLVRGAGEIVESLVSKSQHESINRQATRGDGASFSRDAFRAAHR